MEIAVSGLANLGPSTSSNSLIVPIPSGNPPKEEAAVLAMMEGVKKKERGSFLKRFVRLGSNRELKEDKKKQQQPKSPRSPNPNKKKVWESPAAVFVPPTTKATKKSPSKSKPPTYIVIGGKHPHQMEMPQLDASHTTGFTAPLDESFNTMGRRSSANGNANQTRTQDHSRRANDEQEEEEDNFAWSSVSDASSVSSTSLQGFMEWKIFGKPEEISHAPSQVDTKSNRSLLRDNPHKDAHASRSDSRRSFQNPSSCYKPPMSPETGNGSSSMLSAPVMVPDETGIFRTPNPSSRDQRTKSNCSTNPSSPQTSYVTAIEMDSAAPSKNSNVYAKADAYPVEEPSRRERGSSRRLSVEDQSRASSRYYPTSAAQSRHIHRMPDTARQPSNRNLERPAPAMPNGSGSGSPARAAIPPSTRRDNWMRDSNADNCSYASSPTILEESKRKKAPLPPRMSHSKDRQRQLQRMNESGQLWFPATIPPTTHTGGHHNKSCQSLNGGRRPKSPSSQRDLIQIYPGVYVPLRSATETETAIAGDFYIHTKCTGCTKDIFCILDAAYVICPNCRFVGAMDEEKGHMRHGLGIGFTGKTLCEMKAKVKQKGTTN